MYPELSIQFSRRGPALYTVLFRFRTPDGAGETQTEVRKVHLNTEDYDADELRADPKRYGLGLGRALFADPAARSAFDHATGIAAGHPALRIRLGTDQRGLKLFRLRWELLRIPDPAAPDDANAAIEVAFTNRIFFSRYLASGDMREIRLRPKADLTALVAVAAPTDLAKYADSNGNPLKPVAAVDEWKIAEEGLAGLRFVGSGVRVTLARLLEGLRAEPDILYLVCHGAMVEGEPQLLLEAEDGTTAFATGEDLVEAFKTLRTLPRLAVLVSCQSGGDAAGTIEAAGAERAVMAAVGPRLAEAGVPAVLAMQGNLDQATARLFLPAFFRVLNKTGQVDEAVTAGRVAAAARPDAWIPVLYTRLVDGRVWFNRGLAPQADGAGVGWRQLALDIHGRKCVPILGSGVLEPFMGTTREIAKRLAEACGYPLSLSGREDLPQVTQFLDTMRTASDTSVAVQVVSEMAQSVADRFPKFGFGDIGLDPGAELGARLAQAWNSYRISRPFEPHQYLARMPQLTRIITTNPDDLMERALAAEGRTPRVHYCRWGVDPADRREPSGPEDGTPQVFHLMGDLSDLDSVTLSEDEYFRFLTANARRGIEKKVIRQPGSTSGETLPDDLADDLLRGALARSSLLFLGFRVTDWDFRTLFRLLLDQNGASGRKQWTHIGVQVDPENGTHGDAVRARDYIERLFRELLGRAAGDKVAVYWGSVEDFLEDLDAEWKRLQPAAPAGVSP